MAVNVLPVFSVPIQIRKWDCYPDFFKDDSNTCYITLLSVLGSCYRKMTEAFFPPAGSDKEAILDLITSRSNKQRIEICQVYKALYGKVSLRMDRKTRKKDFIQGL